MKNFFLSIAALIIAASSFGQHYYRGVYMDCLRAADLMAP